MRLLIQRISDNIFTGLGVGERIVNITTTRASITRAGCVISLSRTRLTSQIRRVHHRAHIQHNGIRLNNNGGRLPLNPPTGTYRNGSHVFHHKRIINFKLDRAVLLRTHDGATTLTCTAKRDPSRSYVYER